MAKIERMCLLVLPEKYERKPIEIRDGQFPEEVLNSDSLFCRFLPLVRSMPHGGSVLEEVARDYEEK